MAREWLAILQGKFKKEWNNPTGNNPMKEIYEDYYGRIRKRQVISVIEFEEMDMRPFTAKEKRLLDLGLRKIEVKYNLPRTTGIDKNGNYRIKD